MEAVATLRPARTRGHLRAMLHLDFYRLLHTPAFYIMLACAAIIPAMVLSMTGAYPNAWQVVAPLTDSVMVSEIGEYANINMIYIFGGILQSIFIGHDYMSGFVKNIFTVHAKKRDYVISKTLIGVFSMVCMIGTYLFGTAFAGIIMGKSFAVQVPELVCCILAKVLLTTGFSSLFTLVNLFFCRHMGFSITSCFVFGTGIPIMGMALMLAASGAAGMETMLYGFLYGAACFASLTAGPAAIAVAAGVSAVWTLTYGVLSAFLVSHRDLA